MPSIDRKPRLNQLEKWVINEKTEVKLWDKV